MSRLISIFFAIAIAISSAGWAQVPGDPGDPAEVAVATGAPSLDSIQAAAQSAAARTDLSEEVKKTVQQTYDAARALVEAAGESEARANSYRVAGTSAPAAIRMAEAKLEGLALPADPATLVTDQERQLPPDELKGLMAAEEAKFAKITADLDAAKDAVLAADRRPAEIPVELATAQERAKEAEEALLALNGIDAALAPRKEAERTRWQAQLAAANAEIAMLEQERLSTAARGQLQMARIDLQQRQAALSKTRLDILRALVKDRVQQVADDAEQVAADAEAAAVKAGVPAAALVSEVRQAAAELRTIAKRLSTVRAEAELTAGKYEQLKTNYELVVRQVDAMDDGGVAAQVLLEQRRQLPDPRIEKRVVRQDGESLADTRLDRIRVDNELRRMTPAPEGASSSDQALAAAKRDVLQEMSGEYERLILAQGELDVTRRAYLAQLETFDALLSEKLFWVRSSPIIGKETFTDLPRATRWFAGSSRASELGRACRAALNRVPALLGLAGVLVVVLFALRGKFRRRLEAHRIEIRRVSTDRYAFTLEVLAFTVLRAFPWAFLMWVAGRTLVGDPAGTQWLLGLGQGLQRAAPVLFGFMFVRELCCKDGLAEGHFRWKPAVAKRLRRGVSGIAILYIPALVVLTILFTESSGEYVHSLGRLVFIAWSLWLALGVGFILRPRDGVLAGHLEEFPKGMTSRLRYGWYGLAILAPVALVGLAAWGYLVTALRLSSYVQATAAIAVGVVVGYALLLRWFTIRERKLALERTLAERKARREAAKHPDAEGAPESEEGGVPEVEREAIDMAEVGAQTRRLLRAVAVSAAAVGLWFAWADALPALRGLDAYPVWGDATWADLLVALLLLVVTVVVAKNLPGILEIAVLRNLPLDPGSRYAAASLAQYVIVGIGIVAMVQVLPIDWSQFGWMVAALSVGLGFGLQEIVANFVCGIILLFERPIRVGDVVTVAGTTGTVSRIRMRATTITDWDRKELVVPNKAFITGEVLNWTLSNTTNRIVINIGVAYGTDTDQARELILKVLDEHPDVSDDPAPLVTFENFGDSSLDFVIRAYLPRLDRRAGVTHELYTELHRRFNEAGFEIPFPQRDLHVRSGWGGE